MSNVVYEHEFIKETEGLFCRCNYGVLCSGQKSTPNWHQHIELLYCFVGRAEVLIEDCRLEFNTGDVVIIDSGKIHSLIAYEKTEFFCVHIDRQYCTLNEIDTDRMKFISRVENGIELIESITKLKKAIDGETLFSTAHINSALLELMILLCEKYSVEVPADVKMSVSFKRVRHLMTYIKQNFDKKLTLELLANEVGINKYQLTREFKAATRQSLNEYINAIRCNYAKRMISGGMSVSEAAFSCGYRNLSYFSKTYKKYCKMLPSETEVIKNNK